MKNDETKEARTTATVASMGGGRTAPGDTVQGVDTRRKIFCGQI